MGGNGTMAGGLRTVTELAGTTGRLLYTVGRNFEEKRYLRPIPKTALNINPDLGQNYYWR